jgi:hypothetical protein
MIITDLPRETDENQAKESRIVTSAQRLSSPPHTPSILLPAAIGEHRVEVHAAHPQMDIRIVCLLRSWLVVPMIVQSFPLSASLILELLDQTHHPWTGHIS